MRSILLVSLTCLSICTAQLQAGENEITASEQRAGWKLLFDGKSADGWRNYKQDKISSGWKVQEGALVRAEKGAGDIVTKEQYGSFELSLEYKISEGGNSGIMFHVTEDGGAPWHTGAEIQVQDNVKGHDPQLSGWLYQLYAPNPDNWTKKVPDATRPVGEWNHVQVRITPPQCEINMNGNRYAMFQKGNDDWNKRVAASKFAKMENFGKPTKGHLCLQDHGDLVSYRNIKIRELGEDGAAPEPIDGTLAVKVEKAFTDMKWKGWEPVDEDGLSKPFRPILVTHTGDGSNRIIVPSQQGVIHAFKDGDKESQIFMDLTSKVDYTDKENEEGFLGMAFHPKFKENGEFYVYYTTKDTDNMSVVSRFRTNKNHPEIGDPASEEELFRIKQPFWNHNGGTLCFGPDGHLYLALGDGGSGNDPFGNGQNLETPLGKILRVDVDHRDEGLNYAIPKDNPFVKTEKADQRIFAYGFRNPWRISFDRQTGVLWCGEVGQNLWEEIHLVSSGGNYGWSLREGAHPFGAVTAAHAETIDPIWEYDHQIGKSITGGNVYRGTKVPELVGKYLYADYVSGKLWALTYDADAKKVTGNHAIPSDKMPVLSFGEDEQGEVYFTTVAADGKGIYRYVSGK